MSANSNVKWKPISSNTMENQGNWKKENGNALATKLNGMKQCDLIKQLKLVMKKFIELQENSEINEHGAFLIKQIEIIKINQSSY